MRQLNSDRKIIENDTLELFRVMLMEDEKSPATIEQYMNCMERFSRYVSGREMTKLLSYSSNRR